MKLTISTPEKVDTFKVLFQNIKVFADDVVIRFGPNGLHMQGMDISLCCCFELKLALESHLGEPARTEDMTRIWTVGDHEVTVAPTPGIPTAIEVASRLAAGQ